jgi:site-specific recombinase XerD
VIPIGARALAWISKYLEESRPSHDPGSDDGPVFLTHTGEPFDRRAHEPRSMGRAVRRVCSSRYQIC